MAPVVIENPIVNSPFEEPSRYFRFDDDGITDDTLDGRRPSQYVRPVPPPKRRGRQLAFEQMQERVENSDFINRVRGRVAIWRRGGYQGVTSTTRALLDYWRDPERERPLFFCQIEALETAIYLAEVADRHGDSWISDELRRFAAEANPDLYRIAFKMATGTGKTVVMAMLVAWQALNKFANAQDARFSDAFLIVTPGITIRDRLRVLDPAETNNYYRERDLVTPEQLQQLLNVKLVITNFHAFQLREQSEGARLTKAIATANNPTALKETPNEMVRRVCRALGNKRNIMVINDEAHHCYRHRVTQNDDELRLSAEDRQEARKANEAARVWITGLEAVKRKTGIRVIYDLSATPFFLRGSGYQEGSLFPWVVSDFSLIDAIEAGLVKIPRVPVSDNQGTNEIPTYRDLWTHIRDALPRKGRGTEEETGEPRLPVELEGALQSLYSNYEKRYQQWSDGGLSTSPVFIVVCNNTNVSNMVYRYISGWEKGLPNSTSVIVPGKLPLFNNEEHGRWRARPFTFLIDSEQLESEDALSADFRRIAATEIAEFKTEYLRRYPGRSEDDISDKDILREVMNTVGKPGRLGEHIRCVVSVSMLSEGWDANTVTHILGIRAFGTQLLCEQVIGRGLRRVSYATNAEGKFDPDYAEVYGVPFSFLPCAGSSANPLPGPKPVRVRALPERIGCEITFPRLLGYRYEVQEGPLTARFSDDSYKVLSTQDVPTIVENAPIVGESEFITLEKLRSKRPQEIAFQVAQRVLEKYFKDDQGNVQVWQFPAILAIIRDWLEQCVVCKDNAFPQMLWLLALRDDAADRIYRAIVKADHTARALKPILRPYDTVGSTRYVDFDTVRPRYDTRPDKCHVNYVVADTDSWEQKLAESLEDMPEVACYVKNQGLGFRIPYTIDGQQRNYEPDFLVQIAANAGGPLTLIVEVTGQRRPDKEVKVATARDLWVPAVNNHGGYGRWAFLEITDPWNAQTEIRSFLATLPTAVPA